MRASGRFDRPRFCRRAAGSGRVALGRATRAKDGFAVGCSWTGLMNATQSSVVRLADRLNAPEPESVPDVAGLMAELGRRGRAAARRLSLAGAEEKNAALRAMAAAIRAAADKTAREAEPGASLFTSQQSSVSPTNTKPDHNKTTAQSLGDKMGRTKDNEVHGSTGESVGDKVKGALGMGKH